MPLDLNPLWGSELLTVNLDLLRHRLDLSFRTQEERKVELFRLTCEGVTEFRYLNDRDFLQPWAYVEATSAEAEDLGDGRVRIRLEFWVEPSGCVIEAGRTTLDRERVPGPDQGQGA